MNSESLEQYLYRRYTEQSAKTYCFTINSFLAAHPKAKKYQYRDIVNHFVELKKRYPNIATRKNILAAIKKYYDYLVETRQRNDHPCKTFTIKGENIAKRTQVQFQNLFTSDELDMLLNRENRYPNLKARNKIIISFLIYNALTCDELVRLDIQNIDLSSSTVYIKGSAKLNSRTLKLNRMQVEWIEDYIKGSRKNLLKVTSNRLLIGQRGNPESVDGINAMLEPLKSLFPDRVLNAKTIRMSVIANWFSVYKHRLEEIQEWAGHRWPSSTLRYKRIDIAEMREKINRWHPLK